MAGRIVVFGATGFTGALTARALVARGLRPVLAARSPSRVSALAGELGDLDRAVADATRPETLAALVGRGDVLVTTVGPFVRWGPLVVEAALAAGAHYLDSTGEPPFIARVFRTWGPQAGTAGCALLTALGYDYVPGNLAAALALAEAGPAATRVDVGYFLAGERAPRPPGAGLSGVSGGTRASMAGVLLEPGLVLRGGRLVAEPPARHLRAFTVDGEELPGLSIGSTEPFTLPLLHPSLTHVGVYLGWAGAASRAVQLLSYPLTAALAVPGFRAGAAALLERVVRRTPGDPDEGTRARQRSLVVAEALDGDGQVLGRATLRGTDPYDFTARFLAWAAEEVAAGGVTLAGALGPVEAFGLDRLVEGVRQAGLERIDPAVS